MAGARSESGETLGARERSLGMPRRFDGVYIKMIGADVVGIALQHSFQHLHDLGRPLYRLSIVRPKLPGVDIHRGVGE